MDKAEESKSFLDKNINDFILDDINKLQDLIKYHSDLYYNKENPIISDFEYDELFKKLQYLEEKFNVKKKETHKVWAELLESTFKKVKHSRPMISLDNTYNEEDLNDFNTRVNKNIDSDSVKQIEYTLEFKFDGLWVELIYKNGKLIQAITRWNWVEWEDVTMNIMQIDNIPKSISYKDHLEVRWEIVMPISAFEDINEKAKKDWTKVFSNPRNAASGSVRMKDSRVTKTRKLKFFAYDLANFDDFVKKENIEVYYDVIKDLEKLWFEISSYFKKLNWISEVIKAIDNFWDLKNTLDFEIDWLVLKTNNISLWDIIGWTEHHPRYAIAYKFPAEILTTKVLSVEHSVWRTWTITPVANLEAINIGWVIVRRATLHNYEEVEKLDVRIWDTVFIKRAWEVIPKIISVVETENRSTLEKIKVPELCPSCNNQVKKDEDKVRYYCSNSFDCPAQHSERLAFAVGKSWFNIDWLWERQVEVFLELWIIHNLVDIFKIEEKRDEILTLEWFQEKSVENLIIGVNKAKKTNIITILTSIWIAGVGKKTAKTLSKLFKNKEDFLNFSCREEDLLALDDIGPEIAKNVIEYFDDENHKKILCELLDVLNIEYNQSQVLTEWFFVWKKVCITWSFDNYKRDDLIKILEENGGEFMSSVSKKTDFLLAWEKAWSKLKKAEEFWVEVLSLEKFLENIK